MKITENEKRMLEELLNGDLFINSESKVAPLIGLRDDWTNEEKGLLGSLTKKHIINTLDEVERYNGEDCRITYIYLNTPDVDEFIKTNLVSLNGWKELKTTEIEDSTLRL